MAEVKGRRRRNLVEQRGERRSRIGRRFKGGGARAHERADGRSDTVEDDLREPIAAARRASASAPPCFTAAQHDAPRQSPRRRITSEVS